MRIAFGVIVSVLVLRAIGGFEVMSPAVHAVAGFQQVIGGVR